MNLLFISYWGIHDGLTQSTVIPHIKILSQYDIIDKIILITIERESIPQSININEKTEHIPIPTNTYLSPFIHKIIDFIQIPKILKQLCQNASIDKIIARGVLAGALALRISKETNIPFYVESFEPHADYMKDTGVWKKWSLKYLYQKKWEKQQCKKASGIMTVAKGYTEYLKNQFSSFPKITTVPCAVDLTLFKFNHNDRIKVRNKLEINEEQIVGVYTGKFGGLYIDSSELIALAPIFDFFKNLKLIILTSNPKEEVQSAFNSIYKSQGSIFIKNVPHYDVPKYLSAADFALSLNKSFPSGQFLSPVKIGEYWANGLPVIMTEGIGDESGIIENAKGGVLFNENNLMSSLRKVQRILDDPDHRKKIPELARKYRSFDKVKEAYERMIISSEE